MIQLERTAIFSAHGDQYRTRLGRWWDRSRPALVVCGQNPSKADAYRDDATITRCYRRAQQMGLGGLEMVNADTYRATYPDDLFTHMVDLTADLLASLREEADAAILAAAAGCGMFIAAWGGDRRHAARVRHIEALLHRAGVEVYCLGRTQGGSPRHPSRLGYAVQPEPYTLAGGA